MKEPILDQKGVVMRREYADCMFCSEENFEHVVSAILEEDGIPTHFLIAHTSCFTTIGDFLRHIDNGLSLHTNWKTPYNDILVPKERVKKWVANTGGSRTEFQHKFNEGEIKR